MIPKVLWKSCLFLMLIESFRLTEGAQLPYFDAQLEEQSADADEPEPMDEVPADVPEAGPLQEERGSFRR